MEPIRGCNERSRPDQSHRRVPEQRRGYSAHAHPVCCEEQSIGGCSSGKTSIDSIWPAGTNKFQVAGIGLNLQRKPGFCLFGKSQDDSNASCADGTPIQESVRLAFGQNRHCRQPIVLIPNRRALDASCIGPPTAILSRH